VLDLDLLLYDATSIDTAALTVPHPRMHARAFVLAPLAELAPTLELPGRGPIESLLRGVADQRIERVASAPDWPGPMIETAHPHA
jgi:2-amino-4-hydroxy-6-hydroxymethyldihydropteridine diphosphokinase